MVTLKMPSNDSNNLNIPLRYSIVLMSSFQKCITYLFVIKSVFLSMNDSTERKKKTLVVNYLEFLRFTKANCHQLISYFSSSKYDLFINGALCWAYTRKSRSLLSIS